MAPYRTHVAPVDLAELAATAECGPRRLVRLRGLAVIAALAVLLGGVVAGVVSAPAPARVAMTPHRADPHRIAAARGDSPTGLSEAEEDELFRLHGMSKLAELGAKPDDRGKLPDTRANHRRD